MKLIHLANGEETVIMEAPHEDALKAKARDVPGYPSSPAWRAGKTGNESGDSSLGAEEGNSKELDLEDGSTLRITEG